MSKKKKTKKKKAKNFTYKGPMGALARKRAGIHLLIVRVPIAVVKRIDAKLKGEDRQPWLAMVIERASKTAKPLGVKTARGAKPKTKPKAKPKAKPKTPKAKSKSRAPKPAPVETNGASESLPVEMAPE